MTTTDHTKPEKKLIGVRALCLSLVITMVLAFLITAIFGPKPWRVVAAGGKNVAGQVGWGLAMGWAVSVPAWIVTGKIKIFAAFRGQMLELADRLDLRGWNPLWMSLCAGVGEEMLFRGALQPLLGIWWTSLVFLVLHARTVGFGSMNPMKVVYAAMIFLASVLLGYEREALGLIAVAVTHVAIDLVGLLGLRIEAGRERAGVD